MSEPKQEKIKLTFWQTIRAAAGPYRRLFSYVKPYRGRFVMGLAFGFAFGAVNAMFPLVVARVTGFIFHGGPSVGLAALKNNPNLLNQGPKINAIVLTCLAIPAVMTVRSLCSFANAYYMQWVSNKVVSDIRVQLFSKMVRHSMDFFNRMQSGQLMSRITNDTRGMQAALTTVSSDVFKQPVTIIGGIAVLLYMDWKFTLVTLVLFPSCLIPIRVFGKRARKAVQSEFADMGEMVVTMQETFAGIRVVKSFAREDHQEKSFRRTNQLLFWNVMRMIRATEAIGPLVETLAAFGVGCALLYVYVANLSAGRFFGLISRNFYSLRAGQNAQSHSHRHAAVDRGDNSNFCHHGFQTRPFEDAPDAVPLPPAVGQVEFRNVTFRYAGGVTDAIKDLTLQIEAGKSYALVGASGAGKSTILSLILRLYDPKTGVVAIDGHNLRKITQRSLREQIGLVSQETFLFHDTIFKNIVFGRLDATEEEVYAAAQTAYAHDFIMAQPQGLPDRHRRQRMSAFRRTTATTGDRACALEERADPSSRRSNFSARFGIGKANSTGTGKTRCRKDGHRHRASAFHHSFRRSDCGHGQRPDQRDRHTQRIAGQIRLLPSAL